MNVNLYLCILAAVSLCFYLLYPSDSTYFMALPTIMTGDLSIPSILTEVAGFIGDAWVPLSATAIVVGVLATAFGANAIIPIVWNLAVFFIIPNFFILPTHLLTLDSTGLPIELRFTIIFLLNALLLLTAMEFWR